MLTTVRRSSDGDRKARRKRYPEASRNPEVLTFHGELDLSRRAEVERVLARIGARDAATATLIDLTDVRYIDTMFLNALLRARERARVVPSSGPRICIVGSPTITRLFTIAGLEATFPLFDDFSLAREFVAPLSERLPTLSTLPTRG